MDFQRFTVALAEAMGIQGLGPRANALTRALRELGGHLETNDRKVRALEQAIAALEQRVVTLEQTVAAKTSE